MQPSIPLAGIAKSQNHGDREKALDNSIGVGQYPAMTCNQASITSEQIRNHMLARARQHCEENGIALSTLSLRAVNDSKFLAKVEKGRGFTVGTYQRVIDWLDEHSGATE